MTSRRILHVSFNEQAGGAAIAMQRIRNATEALSSNNSLLVVRATYGGDSLAAFGVFSTFFLRRVYSRLLRLLSRLLYRRHGRIRSFGVLPTGIHKKINNFAADYVFLHWVGGEMISFWDLKKIKGRIIIVLHDLWLLNGTAHLSDLEDLDGHRLGVLIAAALKARKQAVLGGLSIALVAPSTFVASKIRQQRKNFCNVDVIGIPICPHAWAPMTKSGARRLLGIHESNEHLIALCVQGSHDENKGIHLMNEICSNLERLTSNFRVVTFGTNAPVENLQKSPSLHIGSWYDNTGLRAVYSAADVVAVPSAFESFGQIAAEAQMTGTPVVAFKETGAEDIVENRITGILVEQLDTVAFAAGINEILSMSEKSYRELCAAAREHAIKKFSTGAVRTQYKDLFTRLENASYGECKAES